MQQEFFLPRGVSNLNFKLKKWGRVLYRYHEGHLHDDNVLHDYELVFIYLIK